MNYWRERYTKVLVALSALARILNPNNPHQIMDALSLIANLTTSATTLINVNTSQAAQITALQAENAQLQSQIAASQSATNQASPDVLGALSSEAQTLAAAAAAATANATPPVTNAPAQS